MCEGQRDRTDQRTVVVKRIGAAIGVEHGDTARVVAIAAGHDWEAFKRQPTMFPSLLNWRVPP